MGPDDVELVRAYTRRVDAAVSDATFSVKDDFEVVVEAEAGSSAATSGQDYRTDLVIFDITNLNLIPFKVRPVSAAYDAQPQGQLGHANQWPRPDQKIVFIVEKGNLTGRENHICR